MRDLSFLLPSMEKGPALLPVMLLVPLCPAAAWSDGCCSVTSQVLWAGFAVTSGLKSFPVSSLQR